MRKPKADWAWDENIVPALKKNLDSFIMEYVKHTKKIYVLGGFVDASDTSTGKVRYL